MEKDSWKALFSFSRRERIGVMLLLLGVAVAFIWPCFLSSSAEGPDEELVWQASRHLVAGLDSISVKSRDEVAVNTGGLEQNGRGVEKSGWWKRKEYEEEGSGSRTPVLFSFDPNTISAGEWRRLGVKERTVRTVMHYIAKGGRFRKAEDLRKIYGLSAEMFEKLVPFVKIASLAMADSAGVRNGTAKGDEENRMAKWKYNDRNTGGDHPGFGASAADVRSLDGRADDIAGKVRGRRLDINQADSVAWEALPGIGGRLAQRILRFREKLGGFYSVDQLVDIYGLPDTVFRRLQPLLACEYGSLKKININTAEAVELKQHPYVSWNMANAIVQYRRQHGLFRSTSDLDKIAIADTAVLRKIRPYLNTE